jgi:hypothetical protein
MFLYHFDELYQNNFLKIKTKIILIYFQMKSILETNRNHTPK